MPRLTLNSGGPGGGNAANRDQTDTFDNLFLFSLRETGLTSLTTGKNFDDSGGSDYGVNESNSDRIAYEFTGTSATDISGVTWWTRSRYDDWSTGADRVLADGSAQPNLNVSVASGLAPGFCLPGPEDATATPTVSDVTVTSDINGNSKVYDNKSVTLTVSATITPVSANVSYQWYKVEDGMDVLFDQATGSELVLDGNVSDSGAYKCVVTATNNGKEVTAHGSITIAIEKATQMIVFEKDEITKTVGEESFTNELTDESVVYGTLSYVSNEPSVATVDENGLVTIVGAGEAIITVTAAGSDEGNYDKVDAFYTLTVEEKISVDKTALQKEYNEDSKLIETDYTKESWEPFAEALEVAGSILIDDTAKQDGVDDALTALVTAKVGLIAVEADKIALEEEIAATDDLVESDYTADSWTILTDALEAAKATNEDPGALQSAVDAVAEALQEALNNLEAKTAEKESLEEEIAAAEEEMSGLSKDDYTEDSWNALEDALAAAKAMDDSQDPLQSAVDAAMDALETALNSLVKKADSGNSGNGKTGLYQITPGKEWGYYVNGEVDTNYTGFQTNANGTWYVENGYIHFDKNSVYKDTKGEIGTKGTWYYVVGNKVQKSFTGLAHYKNQNGWWYIVNGMVDFTHNGVDKNQNGWWYVTGGKVQFGFTGLANYKNANGWWYIKGGKVDFSHNGVDKNKNGWWYVTDGKVQFGFTGIASNANGIWYLSGGKVQFSYSGSVAYNGGTYTVRNGKVT